ncbi:hypothetical protein RFI_11143, partial [Reticulomyxa filosa]
MILLAVLVFFAIFNGASSYQRKNDYLSDNCESVAWSASKSYKITPNDRTTCFHGPWRYSEDPVNTRVQIESKTTLNVALRVWALTNLEGAITVNVDLSTETILKKWKSNDNYTCHPLGNDEEYEDVKEWLAKSREPCAEEHSNRLFLNGISKDFNETIDALKYQIMDISIFATQEQNKNESNECFGFSDVIMENLQSK